VVWQSPLVRLDRVWLRYGRRAPWVLRDVDLELGPGRSAVVLGRNGVGKSTLLQLAAGVLTPTRGAVRDRPATVGWVPERFPGDQPHTVRQYLTAMGSIRGISGSALTQTVADWTERLGLAAYLDVRLSALSKGTAQKVGLAQALLRPPDLLILDEPWEGLDGPTRELVPELIREVREAGGAVLVSDHRGETVRLPDAEQWTVADGSVSVVFPTIAGSVAPGGISVVELAVPAFRVAGVVADLRAAGHQVLRVRPPEPTDGAAETTPGPDVGSGEGPAAVAESGAPAAGAPPGAAPTSGAPVAVETPATPAPRAEPVSAAPVARPESAGDRAPGTGGTRPAGTPEAPAASADTAGPAPGGATPAAGVVSAGGATPAAPVGVAGGSPAGSAPLVGSGDRNGTGEAQ